MAPLSPQRLLACKTASSDACVPAAIHMLQKTPHYGLCVRYVVNGETVQRNCTKSVALVLASVKSKMESMHKGTR